MKYDKLTIIGWPTDGDEGEDAMVAYNTISLLQAYM